MRGHLIALNVVARILTGACARFFVATLGLSVTLPGVAAPLSAHTIDLIRHEKFVEAETLADADLAKAQADADHHPEAFCVALERSVLVNYFDLLQPLASKLSTSERALQCREKLPTSIANAAKVIMLKALIAPLAMDNGDRKRASALLDEAGAQIKRYRMRMDSADYAIATNMLGNVAANANGDFAGALAWTQESLSALRGNDTQNRIVRARLLIALCYRYARLGRFDEAEAAGRSAAALSAQIFESPSSYRAYMAGFLGQVQYFAHHLADAAVNLEQAIDDDRHLGERAQSDLASNLGLWANVQEAMGDYERGREAFTEAIAVMRRSGDSKYFTELASMLGNLGMLEAASGHCDAALAPEREAFQMFGQRYGEDNEHVMAPLTVLGNCELETNQIDKASDDYRRALALAQKSLGDGNPEIADYYQDVALVDLAMHDYDAASAHLLRALAVLPADPDTMGSMRIAVERNLARVMHAQGHDDAAFEHAVAAETERQRQLQHFAAALDQDESLHLRETEPGGMDEVLALTAAHSNPSWIEQAWQLQIGSRGLITHLVAARLKAARASADPQVQALWATWNTANAEWTSALEAAEAGNADPTKLGAAREALERAEQALAEKTHGVVDASTVDMAALRAALPENSALVGFVASRNDPWGNDFASVPHPAKYYAFRLVSGASPALIDLGNADALDAAVHDWTAALRDPARAAADVDTLGRDVARRLWQPLGLSDGLRRLYVVPEGELHRLAWLALPLRDGLLVERGPVPALLGSERELLTAPVAAQLHPRALLIGDIAPDASLAACSGPRSLPGTRRELDAVGALWKESGNDDSARLVGSGANKTAVRSAMSQSMFVHFATHAFVDESDCAHNLLATRGLRVVDAHAGKNAPALSGLLLAADSRASGADRNGLLTAPEIAAMRLDGVDTVTLAACDTGRGEVHSDEGVFGLGRAFRLAGVRDVVMSLWSVDDAATVDLMKRMYQARWVQHAAPAEALAEAARVTLADRRAAGQSTHPYYWAAFVVVGEAR